MVYFQAHFWGWPAVNSAPRIVSSVVSPCCRAGRPLGHWVLWGWSLSAVACFVLVEDDLLTLAPLHSQTFFPDRRIGRGGYWALLNLKILVGSLTPLPQLWTTQCEPYTIHLKVFLPGHLSSYPTLANIFMPLLLLNTETAEKLTMSPLQTVDHLKQQFCPSSTGIS